MHTRLSFLLRLHVVLFIAHAYVAWRLAAAVEGSLNRAIICAALLAVYALILSGFETRRSTGKKAGDLLAWAGFVCLGLFSWLFVLTVLRDGLLIIATLVGWVYGSLAHEPAVMQLEPVTQAGANTWFAHLHAWSAALVPITALLAVLLGGFNARRTPHVKHVDIALPGLPPELAGFRIVQLSDVHVGPTIRRPQVQAMVEAANALQADVIALTGDLVDGTVDQLRAHTQPFAELQAQHGVFVVTGNHEYYSGADQWIHEFRRLGLTVLCNQHQLVQHQGATLLLAGINDYGAGAYNHNQASNPAAALHGAPAQARPRIMLAHQPRSAAAVEASGFDLQLSGHTHGGQFWPWNYFVPLQQPFVAGLHRVGNMLVYVSRGSGYWGPPMRVGAPSEITCIRLQPGES